MWGFFFLFQALWLDTDEGGVKAAEGAGLKAMLVKNVDDILDKAASFTGVQVHSSESSEISAHLFLPVESISCRLSSRLPFFCCDETSKQLQAAFRKNPKKDEEETQEAIASLANDKEISVDAKTVYLDC